MSKPTNYGPNFNTEDAVSGFLDVAAKICFWVGMLAVVASAGLLLFTFHHFLGTGSDNAEIASALSQIELMTKILIFGAVAGAIGSTFLFWGEEAMHVVQLVVAAVLGFCPFYMPILFQVTQDLTSTSGAALAAVSKGGIILGVLSLLALAVEMGIRMRVRMLQGSRTEQLRYGKGIKEEKFQNKLLGKCWQLPFCRQFV